MKTYRYKSGVLVRGDAFKLLDKVRRESVDLVFADPPFNIGYEYDQYNDKVDPVEYLSWCGQWIRECVSKLKPTGSMFVAIGDDYAAHLKLMLDESYLHMRNWIIWHYTFGVYCQKKFGRDHTHVLYYTKDPKEFTFNADAIREPSARQTKYRDQRAVKTGRVPGDVWTFPRVCGSFRERTDHPCQMPESVLDRIVKVASHPRDVVLDPFAGSGTTAAVCAKLKRRFITFELSRKYAKGVDARLRRAENHS